MDLRPNAQMVSGLTKCPKPRDLRQLRTLSGGFSYYRKFSARHIQADPPDRLFLRKDPCQIRVTYFNVGIARKILAEISAPLSLDFPDWETVADSSRPFHAYCDVGIDIFGTVLEQEQPCGSVGLIHLLDNLLSTPGDAGLSLAWKPVALFRPSTSIQAIYGGRGFA